MGGCGGDRGLGEYGRDELNSNGKRMLAFASDNTLALTNTCISVRKVGTPHTFNGIISSRNDQTRIGYILSCQAHRPRVHDVKVRPQPPPPAKAASDHSIVHATVRLSGRFPPNRHARRESKIRPIDRQNFRSDGGCRQRLVARILATKLPFLPSQPNSISEMAKTFTDDILDAVAKDVPPPTTALSQTRVVRPRGDFSRHTNSMGCEGGCPTSHAHHQEEQSSVEDAEDCVREPAKGD